MSVCFWGINLDTTKKRNKAKCMVLYSILSHNIYYDCQFIENQLRITYPNYEIRIHFVKLEEYQQLKNVIKFKQI